LTRKLLDVIDYSRRGKRTELDNRKVGFGYFMSRGSFIG